MNSGLCLVFICAHLRPSVRIRGLYSLLAADNERLGTGNRSLCQRNGQLRRGNVSLCAHNGSLAARNGVLGQDNRSLAADNESSRRENRALWQRNDVVRDAACGFFGYSPKRITRKILSEKRRKALILFVNIVAVTFL